MALDVGDPHYLSHSQSLSHLLRAIDKLLERNAWRWKKPMVPVDSVLRYFTFHYLIPLGTRSNLYTDPDDCEATTFHFQLWKVSP